MLGNPRLLILDEPTTHLDVAAVQSLMAGLTEAEQRPAILIVSHDPAVVGFADTVWHLDDGALRQASAAQQSDKALAP